MSQKTGLDPRAERSRAWMRAALLALMREKDYQKITVAEITDRAGLSRPTFYLHYKSKDEVLVDHLITEIAHIFDEFSVNIQKTGGVQPGLLATQKLFKEVRGYADVFQVVQQIGAERIVRQSLYHSFFAYLQDLARRYQVEVRPEIHRLSAQFLAASTVGMVFTWLQDEQPTDPEQMGAYVDQVILVYLRAVIRDRILDSIFI
ncbi:MAG TPA: TetR/AcrR family transcriptional regulator [Anaerolineaceae bacterium]